MGFAMAFDTPLLLDQDVLRNTDIAVTTRLIQTDPAMAKRFTVEHDGVSHLLQGDDLAIPVEDAYHHIHSSAKARVRLCACV